MNKKYLRVLANVLMLSVSIAMGTPATGYAEEYPEALVTDSSEESNETVSIVDASIVETETSTYGTEKNNTLPVIAGQAISNENGANDSMGIVNSNIEEIESTEYAVCSLVKEIQTVPKYYEVYDVYYGSNEYHSLNIELQEYMYDLCVEYGIEEHFQLLLCQLFYESCYNPNAISATNDYGIAQINIMNHQWLKQTLGVTNFLDPKQSILCNVYLMSDNLKELEPSMALLKYNTGRSWGEPNNYVRNIMDLYENQMREISQ